MSNKMCDLKDWLEQHKGEIVLIAKVTMLTFVSIAIVDKLEPRKTLMPTKHANVAVQPLKPHPAKSPHLVQQHLRTLPDGRKASIQKRVEMQQLGYRCPDNITLVDQYHTGRKTA